jgi:hypothetical protein
LPGWMVALKTRMIMGFFLSMALDADHDAGFRG